MGQKNETTAKLLAGPQGSQTVSVKRSPDKYHSSQVISLEVRFFALRDLPYVISRGQNVARRGRASFVDWRNNHYIHVRLRYAVMLVHEAIPNFRFSRKRSGRWCWECQVLCCYHNTNTWGYVGSVFDVGIVVCCPVLG